MGSSRFHTDTYVDGDPLEITEELGMSQATLTVLSGTCVVEGDYPLGPVPAGSITLSAGMTVTLSARGPGAPLSGITITPSNPGSVAVILQP